VGFSFFYLHLLLLRMLCLCVSFLEREFHTPPITVNVEKRLFYSAVLTIKKVIKPHNAVTKHMVIIP